MSSTGYEPQYNPSSGLKRRINAKLKFNGSAEHWPTFVVQFKAELLSMGKKCSKALRQQDPYRFLQYTGEDDEISKEDVNTVIHEGRLEEIEDAIAKVELGIVTFVDLHEKLQADLMTHATPRSREVRGIDDMQVNESVRNSLRTEHKAKGIDDLEDDEPLINMGVGSNPEQERKVKIDLSDSKKLLLMLKLLEKKTKRAHKAAMEQQRLQAEYNEICEKIYGTLIACLGITPIKKIKNSQVTEGNGIAAWKALKQEYEQHSGVNLRSLFSKLIMLKMEKRHNRLTSYLYEFNRIIDLLKNMDTDLPEQMLIAILLGGLKDDYTPIINILNAKPDVTLNEVIQQLKIFATSKGFDEHRPVKKQKRNNEQGLSAREIKKSGRSRKMRCYNCGKDHAGGEWKCTHPCKICGKADHTRYNCPQRKKAKQKQDESKKDASNEKANAAISQAIHDLQEEMKALKTASSSSMDFGLMMRCNEETEEETDEESEEESFPNTDAKHGDVPWWMTAEKGRRCVWCMKKTPHLRLCQRCYNPAITYCSDYCAKQDEFEHFQFCTAESQAEWEKRMEKEADFW